HQQKTKRSFLFILDVILNLFQDPIRIQEKILKPYYASLRKGRQVQDDVVTTRLKVSKDPYF
ncbi:MAG: hypothetical protein UT60_C0033G0013, partial [candidate division CPR2 bacterium GW2011_GWD2_39_7]